MGPTPHLPRDFSEEVDAALRETKAQLSGDVRRLAALQELAVLCRRLAHELARPVSVFDVVRTATSDGERCRRRALIHLLRSRPPKP